MPEAQGDVATRVAQLRRAGEEAEYSTLWTDAISAYESCLTELAADPAHSPQDEAALLTALGRCYWNLAEARTAWRTLRRAISLCQQHGDGVGQARATVEILRIWGPPERQRQMAEEALEAVGDADPGLRARLLMRLRWWDEDHTQKFEEAMAIAERHGLSDILVARVEERGWRLIDEGRFDEARPFIMEAHEIYAAHRMHDMASGILRGFGGFALMQAGHIDDGLQVLEKSIDYALEKHVSFTAQLALMDVAAAAYARGDFERCEQTIARSPGTTDFRGELYRMWMAEARGDTEGALRMMVSPDRGGNATTAMGQIHVASAGVLFRAGRREAAESALRAWAAVERGDRDDLVMESPAALECILELGDDGLMRAIKASREAHTHNVKFPVHFATLQGRAFAPVVGGVYRRLGELDEAERILREGLEFCERERLIADAQRCREGLEAVASAR